MALQFGNLPNTTIGKTDGTLGTGFEPKSFGTGGFGGNALGVGAVGNNGFGNGGFGQAETEFNSEPGFGAGINRFGSSNFGGAMGARPFEPQEIGAEYLEASAGYLAAKSARESADRAEKLQVSLGLEKQKEVHNPPLVMQQSIGFKSCFLNDTEGTTDSLYKMAITNRLKKSRASTVKEEDEQAPISSNLPLECEPRMLSCENVHGRVDLLQLVRVPPTFDLSDYVEIGHKYVSLRCICDDLRGIPAKITLFEVFPQGRTASDISQYRKTLEEHTTRLGGTLVGYNEQTGIWEFELEELV